MFLGRYLPAQGSGPEPGQPGRVGRVDDQVHETGRHSDSLPPARDRIERQHGSRRAAPSSRAIVDFPVPGAPETTMRVKPQRAAISYGLGCLVSHCQNVRYGGRAMKWPLPTLPETSIRSTSGPS